MLPEIFDSHKFILALAQKHKSVYIQALNVYANHDQPFFAVHSQIGRRLKKHVGLVKQIDTKSSKNMFGYDSNAAI